MGMNIVRALQSIFKRAAPVEAGSHGPRWAHGKVLRAPAQEATRRRQLAADRAAWLAMNDATAASIIDRWASNLVSDGPSIVPRTNDDALRRSVTDSWARWWDRADAEGRDDFGGILSRAARGIVASGEAFLAVEVDDAGELVLRSLAPEQVDASLTRPAGTGGNIIAGVEMDRRGRPTAYWVRPATDALLAYMLTARPVDAGDVLHVFRRDHPGQVRGLSWLAPIATLLSQIGELQDSVLATANTAALFGGVLTNISGQPTDGVAPAAGLMPGALVELPAGMDIKFSSPPALTGADATRREMLRSVAAGVGLPFELVTGDLSQVNYSSMRAGFGEFRKRVDVLRRTMIEAQLIRPLWRKWLAFEAMHGRISASVAAELEPLISWPAWLPIDPQKETAADILALDAGLTSRAELVAKRGRDLAELDAEIAADRFVPRAAPTTTPEESDA
ncbi:phage portal protein [Ancylobacter oerskovii]|uniref:Phage portal protein n=1 Tax=Ancylobacter oerskovii TaxID=459519 RepID=A0ABW4Z5E4_9HYPH|nr:phage portal protein [Ancylobacter oerskovii]MBS7545727.1 phage portal protein [Ancylobacter oerskovii]